ncbi:MAG TPA: DNA methyltransferase [Nostocaceae cyanobacterium]|nr:DNA methyltransferase [Nostocaceae cyanobacterium]
MTQLNLFDSIKNYPQANDSLKNQNLSTNIFTNRYSIHRWYNFIAGFSPEFVSYCINAAQLTPNDIIIEPFSGLGTTLVEANFQNVYSIGFEANPFFHDISKAKLFPPSDTGQIKKIKDLLLSVSPYEHDLQKIWSQDALTFLNKLFSQENLRFLANALTVESNLDSQNIPIYRLIVSKVLEYTSLSQTDGIYKAPTSLKKAVNYLDAVSIVCHQIEIDIENIDHNFNRKAQLNYGSSENMSSVEDESCSLCVTSPPYLNNFDFAEMTRMELYFWRYANSWKDITEKVRRHLIVNTTTAPTDLKKNQELFSASFSPDFRIKYLQPLVEKLIYERKNRPGKKDYYLLVYPYFSQMQNVIRELRRILKPNSHLHLIIADAALYGIYIPTQEILSEIMKNNGFKINKIDNLRTRGERWILTKRTGSSKLGEYHIYAERI